MARETEKKPGRLRTIWSIFQLTRRNDKAALPLILAALLLPLALSIVLPIIFNFGPLSTTIWIISGLLVGIMLAMFALTNRGEKVALRQIAGRPGAVGAILKNGLRGSWSTSEMPVSVNPKTQDAVYRAVGRAGIVLISEGPQQRVARIVGDEQRKVKRIVPNVPIHTLSIGPESNLPLGKLTRSMRRLPRTLTRAEVMQVANRLTSLGGANLPIPKGIDPSRVRPGRPR